MVSLRTVISMVLFLFALGGARAAPQTVMVLPISGAISPASADFAVRNLARAEKEGAQLVVLQIDTPGGLDTSMRQIIKAILASPVPVASFVAPGGARAASAGTYILYASHIAAMAPGTNVGAATPVRIGAGENSEGNSQDRPGRQDVGEPSGKRANPGAMASKQVHDAAAYIRGLAQLRGRNAEWGERAVREAVSLSADEALAQQVIDLTARDVPDLLAQLDGRKIATAEGERILATKNAPVVITEPDWKNRLLAVITEPSVALILMMLGLYGLWFEFANPGLALPGVVGAICLLLGLFALQLLPVNYAGLALIALGLGFMVAEVFIGSFGILAVAGMVAFSIGAVMLIDTDQPGFGIPLALIAGLAATTALFAFFVSGLAWKARLRPVVSGREQLANSIGVMLEDADTEGWAQVHGERWHVRSDTPVRRNQQVRVTARNGLVLSVTPLDTGAKGER